MLFHRVQPFPTEVTAEGFLNKALFNAPVPPNTDDASVAVIVEVPAKSVKDAEVVKEHRDGAAVSVNVFLCLLKPAEFAEMDWCSVVYAELKSGQPTLK